MSEHEQLILLIKTSNPLLCSVQDGFIGAAGAAQGLPCFTANHSVSWRDEIEKSLQCLPPVYKNILSANDVKIVLAGHPADVGRISTEPDPNDFYKRSDVETAAYYARMSKAVVLPERHFNKGLNKNVPMYNVPQVVIHELTHALDDILKISEQPEAISAYKIDVASLTSPQAIKRYGYLLQDGVRGRSEAIAEMGSLIWSGDNVCRSGDADWCHLSSWMRVYFNEIANSYDPAEGLTDTFKNAAANKAENEIMSVLLVHDDMGYRLMSDIAMQFAGQSKSDGQRLPVEQARKKQAIKDILCRQGDDAVTEAYQGHNERMKTQFRSGSIIITRPSLP